MVSFLLVFSHMSNTSSDLFSAIFFFISFSWVTQERGSGIGKSILTIYKKKKKNQHKTKQNKVKSIKVLSFWIALKGTKMVH